MTKLYGNGSLIERVKGKKYRIKFSGGKDPVTGKYIQYTETFVGTKRQAQLRIEQIRREFESGKAVEADKVTFAEWVERYLVMREESGKYRHATLSLDRSRAKHLINGLGNARITDITPAVIDSLYSSMRKSGMGDTTMLQCHKLLKRVMAYAVNNDLIMRNPVDRVETPRKPKPQREALSVEDAQRLSAIAATQPLACMPPRARLILPRRRRVYLCVKIRVIFHMKRQLCLGMILQICWNRTVCRWDLCRVRPWARIFR